jgi:cell division septation protein DedD
MKNARFIIALALSFCLGASLVGNLTAVSEAATANYSPHKVIVEGVSQNFDAYNINGYNYYKLRDIAKAVDFGVWFDDAKNTVYISTYMDYDPNYTGPASVSETKPASTAENTTPAPKPSTVTPAPKPAPAPAPVTVYITRTGEKYHVGTCSYLRQSKISIELSEAKRQGYTPCSRCNPPR